MSNTCSDFLDGLSVIAFGGEDPEALGHATGCAACGRALKELTQMASALQMGFKSAPPSAVEEAKRIVSGARPSALMRLFGTTLQGAGARASETDSFQLLYKEGGQSVRLLYAKSGSTWEVVGEASEAGWRVETGSGDVPVDRTGRFGFSVRDLSETGILLHGKSATLRIPPASEVPFVGPETSR